jgi:hypothetical protein
MKSYIQLLAPLIFIVSIWTINSFLEARLTSELKQLQESKKDLALKKSFAKQGSTVEFSQSIEEFVPIKFDKSKITNIVNTKALESSVKITKFDIQPSKTEPANDQSEKKDSNIEKEISFNKFKTAKLDISFAGDKSSIDIFLYRLVTNKPYIEILSYNLDFKSTNPSMNNGDISGTITAQMYYRTN